LKLCGQGLPQAVGSRAQLTSPGAELQARGPELGSLIVGQAQLLLRSRGKPLLDPVPQRISPCGAGVCPLRMAYGQGGQQQQE
jgi:hypothetical protein